jgi:ElaB/YqjD/DUF883 family membrane-anchored ribosome-binding protein
MHETTADVRRDIEETRVRVSRTLAELETEVGSRKDAVVERVVALRDGVTSAGSTVQETIADFAREHPWYALATAVGIGLVIGRTGADEAAARAGVDKAKGLLHRTGESESVASNAGAVEFTHDPQTGAIGSSSEDLGQPDAPAEPGIAYRLQAGIVEALGGNELLEAMRMEAGRIGRG